VDRLTHLDSSGAARIVDVGDKPTTRRRAVAQAVLVTGPEVVAALREARVPKGNALETARVAGLMAAKRTSELIPLCHPLALDHAAVDFEIRDDRIVITASAAARGPTGVEMEALTAAAVAGLTLYDMLKSLSMPMTLDGVRLVEKTGGRSGPVTDPG
jgi:cyclic pyranopterin phosphate synthase